MYGRVQMRNLVYDSTVVCYPIVFRSYSTCKLLQIVLPFLHGLYKPLNSCYGSNLCNFQQIQAQ